MIYIPVLRTWNNCFSFKTNTTQNLASKKNVFVCQFFACKQKLLQFSRKKSSFIRELLSTFLLLLLLLLYIEGEKCIKNFLSNKINCEVNSGCRGFPSWEYLPRGIPPSSPPLPPSPLPNFTSILGTSFLSSTRHLNFFYLSNAKSEHKYRKPFRFYESKVFSAQKSFQKQEKVYFIIRSIKNQANM